MIFQMAFEMVSHGHQLPRRRARGDNHKVSDGGFSSKRDGDNILRFVVIERRQHKIKKR